MLALHGVAISADKVPVVLHSVVSVAYGETPYTVCQKRPPIFWIARQTNKPNLLILGENFTS